MVASYFIGIDVSKDTLDLALITGNEVKTSVQIANTVAAAKKAVKELVKQFGCKLENTIFCMEHTGIYNNHLLTALQSLKAQIWLENPTQIKYSLGLQRGKNDCLDAKRIALYAYKNRDNVKLWTAPREVITKLKKLNTLRDRLVAAKKMLSTLVNEEKAFVDKATYKLLCEHTQKSQKALKNDLNKINKTILNVIREDEQLSKLFEEVASVPGVGQVTATELIVATNEFKNFSSAKQIACYAGVVPFEYRSGSSIRSRAKVSHKANKYLKTLLHLAALKAIQFTGRFKDYYERKVREGKNKMAVLNAVRNKIIHTVYALVKHEQNYNESYIY